MGATVGSRSLGAGRGHALRFERTTHVFAKRSDGGIGGSWPTINAIDNEEVDEVADLSAAVHLDDLDPARLELGQARHLHAVDFP